MDSASSLLSIEEEQYGRSWQVYDRPMKQTMVVQFAGQLALDAEVRSRGSSDTERAQRA